MCFIERKTRYSILQLGEVFPWRETVLRAYGMISDEKPFFWLIYTILWEKMVHVIDRYFYLWRVLKMKMFFARGYITDSPFKQPAAVLHLCLPPTDTSGPLSSENFLFYIHCAIFYFNVYYIVEGSWIK